MSILALSTIMSDMMDESAKQSKMVIKQNKTKFEHSNKAKHKTKQSKAKQSNAAKQSRCDRKIFGTNK